jgi:hypothetical protein
MTTPQAFICDAIRTPFGRYGGALSSVRTDDLGAIPLRALMARNPNVDWASVTDVLYGCANQAGEDNRNVAHMSSLLAGLPIEVPGGTHQPPVRLGPGCRGHSRTRHQGRRSRADDCRWRGKHEPRPLRHAQSRKRLQPQQCCVRHNHRLALHQQADEGPSTASIPCPKRQRTWRSSSASSAPPRTTWP